jgi:hypothetical protein
MLGVIFQGYRGDEPPEPGSVEDQRQPMAGMQHREHWEEGRGGSTI